MVKKDFIFESPAEKRSIIKVVGVGGGGSNAVNFMFKQGIKDVEFIVVNTDVQALRNSPVPNKLQIGVTLTEGLGAGANPEKGRDAALESKDEITELFGNGTKMVFITAGMGGGTGTGAAPVLAQIAQSLGILTVAIVTAPFNVEGRKKKEQAYRGIEDLKKHCDTVLVILNDKLIDIYGELPKSQAFAQADSVLTNAAKSIAEIITTPGYVNVDFEDVKKVMKSAGQAVMGSAAAKGENRAKKAIEDALSSPLLNNRDIRGAKKILLVMFYSRAKEMTMTEQKTITDYIEEKIGIEADELIPGDVIDESLEEYLRVTIIATGFDSEGENDKIITTYRELESGNEIKQILPETEEIKTVKEESVSPKTYLTLDGYAVQNLENDEPKTEEQPQRQELERRAALLRKINQPLTPEELKAMEDIPSYMRRNVKLQQQPPAAENPVSRFRLDEESGIVKDNKFLHDNVD
jgi:cell division protein FtsZ